MKVSEMTIFDVAKYLKLDAGEYDPAELELFLDASKEYVADYTGIPQASEDTEADTETLDSHAKFSIAVLALCQEFYDNRTIYSSKNNINKVLQSILFMHRKNLI